MELKTHQYRALISQLPTNGKQLLAYFNESDVLVYVPQIGEFYGDKTVSRPVWITPSFTWIMHDSDWLRAENYNSIECMKIKRSAFEEFLEDAVSDTYDPDQYASEAEWQSQKANTIVTYRWKTDFHPDGTEAQRQILHLGIHSRSWMQSVMRGDIAAFTEIDEALFTQYDHAQEPYDLLIVPYEQPYPVSEALRQRLKLQD